MDLQSVQALVESAAQALENPHTRNEAERALLEFRGSKAPFPACQHILAHTSVPGAAFQAVLALREAALRSWPELDAGSRRGVVQCLLEQSLARAGERPGYVRTQCAAAAAQLVKRGHADGDLGDLAMERLVPGIAERVGDLNGGWHTHGRGDWGHDVASRCTVPASPRGAGSSAGDACLPLTLVDGRLARWHVLCMACQFFEARRARTLRAPPKTQTDRRSGGRAWSSCSR